MLIKLIRALNPAAGLLCMLLSSYLPLFSQSTNAPHSKEYYSLPGRYEINSGSFSEHFHTSFKPLQRRALAAFTEARLEAARIDSLANLSKIDVFNLQFLADDNWEWSNAARVDRKPLLKLFYQHTPDLYSIDQPELNLHVKPVLQLQTGVESNALSHYINTRGIDIRGMINRKVGFYSFLAENQARFLSYVRDYVESRKVVPAEGFWKDYKESGVDFFTSSGYISFNATKHINMQFGQDRFFIGNGMRSMILSDAGHSFPFLKIQTQVWRFSYTNLFARLSGNTPASRPGSPTGYMPEKFMALHHLSLNITDQLNIGLFEAIVSGDSVLGGFQVDYLNPVIFYRATEHNVNNSTTAPEMRCWE